MSDRNDRLADKSPPPSSISYRDKKLTDDRFGVVSDAEKLREEYRAAWREKNGIAESSEKPSKPPAP